MDIRHREAHLDLKRHQLPSDLRRSQRRLRLRPLLLRGLIRLVRDELGDKQYKRENIFYRDLNRRLSKVRDTAALAESLSKLEERFAEELTENALASVRRYLTRATRKRQAEKKRALVHVRKKIIAARKRVKKWSIKNDNVSVAGPGLNQIYSQGRAGFSKAYKNNPWRDVGVQYQELVLSGEVLTAPALSCGLSMYLMSVVPPLIALASAIGIVAGASANLWLLFILAASSWFLKVLVLAIASKRSEVSSAYAFTAPLGLSLLYAMLFDSSIRITTGKGVTWKGRRIYERRGVRPPRFPHCRTSCFQH